MQFDFSRWGPLTVLVVVLVVIGATVGGVVVIVHPETLNFSSYLSDLAKFAVGLGALGVGHGLVHASEKVADATVIKNALAPPGTRADGEH